MQDDTNSPNENINHMTSESPSTKCNHSMNNKWKNIKSSLKPYRQNNKWCSRGNVNTLALKFNLCKIVKLIFCDTFFMKE